VPSRQITAGFGGADPQRLAQFWAGVLGRQVVEAAHGLLLPGDDAQLGLRFVHSERQHFDLATDGDRAAEVDRLVGLGATSLGVGKDGAALLTDPDGFEFCLLT
jgi:hypothetical protein